MMFYNGEIIILQQASAYKEEPVKGLQKKIRAASGCTDGDDSQISPVRKGRTDDRRDQALS